MSARPTATTLEALRAMRELLADESRWCKGAYARDARGDDVSPLDMSACSWCMLGAIKRIVGDEHEFNPEYCQAKLEIYRLMTEILGSAWVGVHVWQDGVSHDEVVGFLDTAISRLEAAQ